MTPERLQKLKRASGYAGFGIVSFFVALYLSFPYDRVKDRIIDLMAANNLDVTVESAGPALGIGIRMKDITVRTRSGPGARPGTKPMRFVLDRTTISVSPLAMLFGSSTVDVAVKGFGGTVDLERHVTKTDAETTATARDIDAGEVPGVKDAINLPLSGTIDVDLELKQPAGRYAESSGFLEFKCAGCVLGDGREKLKIAGNPMLAEGLTIPKINLGDFGGRVAIEKGTGKFQGIQAKSPDGEITIEGEIMLRDPLQFSTVRAYVRFKMSDALLKKSDKLGLLLQLAESMGKRPDGYFGLRINGRLDMLDAPEWSKTSPFASTPATASRTPGGRPSITAVRPTPAAVPNPAEGARSADMIVTDDQPPPPPPVPAPSPPAPAPPGPTAGDEVMQGSPPGAAAAPGEAARHPAPPPVVLPAEQKAQAGDKPPPTGEEPDPE